MKKANFVFLQYPISGDIVTNNLLNKIKKTDQAKFYFIIHDIESLRFRRNNEAFLKQEVKWLNCADGLIVHSDQMKKFLVSSGVNTPMVVLGIFDYINPQPVNEDINYDRTACFAGNLVKSNFISKINFSGRVKLSLYGPRPPRYLQNDIKYEGVFSPEQLPKHLSASFGLVWDGDSVDTCNGITGEYMRYNSPHKVSLYLSTGIPVIIWDKAAVANYITQNKLGVTISSLDELPKVFDNLSASDYLVLKKNAIKEAKRLRSGKQITEALRKIISLS